MTFSSVVLKWCRRWAACGLIYVVNPTQTKDSGWIHIGIHIFIYFFKFRPVSRNSLAGKRSSLDITQMDHIENVPPRDEMFEPRIWSVDVETR